LPAVDSQAERAAKNESLFREVNERIVELTETFEAEGLEMLCECSDSVCTKTFQVTVTEYAAVRSGGTRFALMQGHQDPAIERVVEQNERFLIVEKIGEAGEVAGELDSAES
jgi:hypothetical protein